MYRSHFPTTPEIDSYLRAGRITAEGETATDMVARIVTALAQADRHFDTSAGTDVFAEQLGWALDTRRIVFSTPIMTNAGRYPDRPLAACAVPPVDLRGDLTRVKNTIDSYHQAGMGTGFSLAELADPVATLRYLNRIAVDGAASGKEDRPVGNMAVLPLTHARAAEFISCKLAADDNREEWKFNISLTVTDADMRAATTGAGREHDLLQEAARAAHACADPGLLFSDRMNEGNPTPHVGEYISTAPCAEVGLVAGETCQFGYVNLAQFHTGSSTATPVDFDALRATVRVLVRALDDAIEASLSYYPTAVSTRVMGAKRKIGVGICGLADLILAAGLPYDSPQARRLAQEVVLFISYQSKLASTELARTRGACPAVLDGTSRYADPAFLKRFAAVEASSVSAQDWAHLADAIATTGVLRNSSTIAIPPTGRSAPVAEASTGIEPLFQLTGGLHHRIHPAAEAALKAAGRADALGFVRTHGRLPADASLPAQLRDTLATATQIAPSGHLAMAAAVQECVDEAVSKTVNLPATAKAQDVLDTYIAAWELGCKGITVYVDGSRQIQPKAL